MFERHVSSKLSAYLHGQLGQDEAHDVAEHLARCEKCRQEYAEITAGAELARNLHSASAPDALWASIQRKLGEAPSPTLGQRFSWVLPTRSLASAAAGILAIAVSAALLWYFQLRQPLQVTVAAAAPSEFESAAMRTHELRAKEDWQWDFATQDPRKLRAWLHLASGLHANFPDERPPEDIGRLQLVGVKLVQAGGARAAIIGYQVDSQPVTLLTARVRDLHQKIGEGFLSKDIVYRSSHGELKAFTWEASGQAYVMVSELPRFGERGCILCHTTPERRELISNMNPQRRN
jgi:anti-sigma factor RsiW